MLQWIRNVKLGMVNIIQRIARTAVQLVKIQLRKSVNGPCNIHQVIGVHCYIGQGTYKKAAEQWRQ